MSNEQVLAPPNFSISENRRMKTFNGLSISNVCKPTLPCKHWVVLPSGESKMMRGSDIYKIIPKEHPSYNHFEYCKKWIEDEPKRRKAIEEANRKSDEAREKIKEQRRLEEEASNYNKQFIQPEFKILRK